MAAEDPSNVFVAGNFHTYIAPLGSTTPTIPATVGNTNLDSAFSLVGYSSVDGSSLNAETTRDAIKVHQSFSPVRMVTTDAVKSFSVTFMEWNRLTFQAAFGGGTFSEAGGVVTYTFPDPEQVYEFALVIDAIDGTRFTRYVAPRVSTGGSITLPLTQTAVAELPTVFDVLEPGGGAKSLQQFTTGVSGLTSA